MLRVRVRRLVTSGALVAGLTVSGLALATGEAAAVSKSKIQVVAHRGDSNDAPEATLAAFGDAIRDGADAIEFDIKFTSDGVPVAMHDHTVDRTTDGKQCDGLVSSLTWAVLHMCDAGSWFGHAFSDEHVPSVDEAVTYIAKHSKTTKIYLHINFSGLTESQAKRLVKVVKDDHLNTSRTTYVGENETEMKYLKKAGGHRLGRMVHTAADWKLTKYPVLVPYSAYTSVVNAHYIKKAVKRGQLVLPVQGHPLTLAQIVNDGANGVYLNNLESGLEYLGRPKPAPAPKPAPPAPKPAPAPSTPAPPTTLPADLPVTPPADPPVTPAADPPVTPPADPPVDPPVDPPADPPVDPPADPPATTPTDGGTSP
ncbi:MAG TPA: glycerophosphodiester phosphodiesterase family protein [Sporichthyaceae bacterium]